MDIIGGSSQRRHGGNIIKGGNSMESTGGNIHLISGSGVSSDQ